MTFTVAKTTITELNRGLTGLGLDVDKAVNINGFPYTYEDLFSEKPRLVMGDNNAKVGLLLDIFDAMGASTKTGSGDCYYGIKAKAAQQALAQIRQIEDAQGMDPTTWVHLEAIVMDFANKSSSEKEAFRSIFCETFTDKYEQLIRDEMSIEVESTTKNSITWDVDVPDYISGEAKLEIYNTNGVKNSEQIVYGDGLVTTGELDYDTVYYASLSYDGISEIKRATTQVPDIELFYYNDSVYPSNSIIKQ